MTLVLNLFIIKKKKKKKKNLVRKEKNDRRFTRSPFKGKVKKIKGNRQCSYVLEKIQHANLKNTLHNGLTCVLLSNLANAFVQDIKRI